MTQQQIAPAKTGEPIIEVQDPQTGESLAVIYAWNNGQLTVSSNRRLKVVELSPKARLHL